MSNKILVVEDSRTIRRMLTTQLTRAGYEPIVAASIEDTIPLLESGDDFLCSILDYCLPDGQDGEVIDLVLSHKIKTIVLTAHMDEKIRQRVLDKGVIDYIPKDSPASVAYIPQLLKRLHANKNHTILVVDDSVTICNHLSTLLEREYLTVVTAKDGIEGIKQLVLHPEISLIVTDHDMPNMDGLTMIREIRKSHDRNQLAILGVSGNNDPGLTARFLKSGANDYVRKPFNQEEFYCRIHHMLNMKDSSDKLYILAHQDSLTGLWNRRHFFDFASNTSTKRPHSYAMLDIDLFKQVNDTYGHDAGDKVLQEVSQLINSFFPNDLVARIGGEEFVVQSIMKPTDFHTQLELLRSELADYTISINGDLIGVTISIGMTSGADKLDVMLKKADSSLYEAKRNGRNQIVCSS